RHPRGCDQRLEGSRRGLGQPRQSMAAAAGGRCIVTDCLSENALQLAARGALPPGQAPAVAEHLDHCPQCRQTLAVVMRCSLTPDASPSRPSTPRAAPEPGLAPYRLLERIGEGGMGEVWLAEQTEPLRRLVALKFIKLGMDSRQVLARFESERQALALMDHPAIARIFDGGTTPDGHPFFAMEYVKGVPITEHCDRHRLTTGARVELFLQLCAGTRHAHQKAILHRDLKPSNVLVALVDAEPQVKIID